jgi:hypothetical protein
MEVAERYSPERVELELLHLFTRKVTTPFLGEPSR